jgi:protein-tyrosine-phosphatase
MDRKIVLFLCPHGAAKSVLAAAFCHQQATVQGLALQATCAGTEPDAEVAPHVRALLSAEGLALPIEQPQLVTAPMLAQAAYIISLGCDQDALPSTPQHWEHWDDVPPPSQDLHGAYARIQHYVAVWLASIEGSSIDD